MDFTQEISGGPKGEKLTPNPHSSWMFENMSQRSTYIECPFCKKKQESNLKIQTTLTKILKDVHFQSFSQNG